MAARLEVDLDLNGPQFVSWNWLFDENGEVQRRRTVFLPWGRGVGKSYFRRQVWWTLIARYEYRQREKCPKPLRGVRITSLMPTLKQFRDVHWADIEEELCGTGPWAWLGAKLDRQTCQIDFPGGSWVKPFPASAHNARTARGMRTDVLDSDEYDDIDADVYDSVAVPWLSEPWSLGLELPGGTPTRGRHGIWWRTLKAAEVGEGLRAGNEPSDDLDPATRAAYASIFAKHATYRDTPETVAPEAAAKARATTPAATFEREWEANPDAGEGLVYPFEEKFHVREPPDGLREFIVGADWGWSDPGVLLRGGIQGHGADATLWIVDEHYESEIPNHIWDERARAWRDAKFWPDPSRPDRINDFRALGLAVGESDNDIFAGIARVADLLFIRQVETMGPAFQPIVTRVARLYVSPRCKNLIREFGLYRRKKLPGGGFDEQPEDKNNHAMDALRYMALGRFGRMPNTRREHAR